MLDPPRTFRRILGHFFRGCAVRSLPDGSSTRRAHATKGVVRPFHDVERSAAPDGVDVRRQRDLAPLVFDELRAFNRSTLDIEQLLLESVERHPISACGFLDDAQHGTSDDFL